MIRRISMAVGIFLTLLLVVLLYQHFSGDDHFSAPPSAEPMRGQVTPGRGGLMDAPTGRGPYMEKTDDDGRIVNIFKAKSWTKRTPTTYDLVRPEIRYFRDDGQQMFIVADAGIVHTSDVRGALQISKGIFRGNVVVLMDSWRDEDHPGQKRTDIANRPADAVRIYADEIEFNDEDMAIHTVGRVAMFSQKADLVGSGLTVQWNVWEGKIKEIRSFYLAHGEYMVIYDIKAFGQKDKKTAKPTRPVNKAVTLDSTASTVQTQSVTKDTGQAHSLIAPLPKPRNIYRAVFQENVRYYSDQSSMENADRVELTFNWDVDSDDLSGRKDKKTARASAGVPASATTLPGANRKVESQPAASNSATQAAAPTTRPEKKPDTIVIHWDGPLEMTPVGWINEADKADKRKSQVVAEGRRVIWSEPSMAAVAQKFIVYNPEDKIELFGNVAHPAIVVQQNEAVIISESIMMDRGSLRAEMGGAGKIVRALDDEQLSDPEMALALAELGELPGGDQITWQRHVKAILGQEEQPRPGEDDGKRLFIREAWLDHVSEVPAGRVGLTKADTDDFISSDKLYIHFERMSGPKGGRRSFPDLVEALGNIVAKQEGSDIRAESLDVVFAPVASEAEKSESAPGKKKDDRLDIQPVYILAGGDVRIRGEKLEIFADTVESYPQEGKTTLTGNPEGKRIIAGSEKFPGAAGVIQGEERLLGYEITLNEGDANVKGDETLNVRGPGGLRFMMDKDLNGKDLETPRPAEVSWKESMDFLGADNISSFAGDVFFRSGSETLTCGIMDLAFEKEAASQPASAPKADEAEGDNQRFGLGTKGLSNRKLLAIVCWENVVLTRSKLNEQEQIIKLMQLKGGHLAHTAASKETRVIGPGSFLSADYELPPEPTIMPATQGKDEGSLAQKPSQTAFTWQDEMRLTNVEDTWRVDLKGKVQMRHRSGDKIIRLADMPPMEDKKLPAGRQSALDCDKLWAHFASDKSSADDKATTKPAADAMAADMGELKSFTAEGSVDMTDGPYTLVGHILDYNRDRKTIVLEGTAVTSASVIYQPSPDAMPSPATGRKIECELDDYGHIIRVRGTNITGGS